MAGLARRATVVKQIRSQHENVVALDNGGWFFGAFSLLFNVSAAAEFVSLAGIDAMAMSRADFYLTPYDVSNGVAEGIANLYAEFIFALDASIPVVCTGCGMDAYSLFP